MSTTLRLLLCCIPLAGCVVPSGEPLVSAQYPPGTGQVNVASEPQPINSLPPGAANLGPGPFATAPNYLSFKFGRS